MRVVSIVLAVLLIALLALMQLQVPAIGPYQAYLPLAALVAAVVLLVTVLAGPSGEAAPKRPVAEAVQPPPAPPAKNQAEAEIVSFLATLQEKGRLVDFLMDDMTPYSDAQVGAAARVVHQGCKAVLEEHFRIHPIREEDEGKAITVPTGYAADEYRLVGKISGESPFKGTLIHRGWWTETVKLPRVLRTGGDRLPAIAPAEVELK